MSRPVNGPIGPLLRIHATLADGHLLSKHCAQPVVGAKRGRPSQSSAVTEHPGCRKPSSAHQSPDLARTAGNEEQSLDTCACGSLQTNTFPSVHLRATCWTLCPASRLYNMHSCSSSQTANACQRLSGTMPVSVNPSLSLSVFPRLRQGEQGL